MTLLALMQLSLATAPSSVQHVPTPTVTSQVDGNNGQLMRSRSSHCNRYLMTDNCRWLYTPILTVDANFRLKCKAKGVKNDPPLGDGWAHWVPESDYQEYIQAFGHQQEVSTIHLMFASALFIPLQPNLCESELRAVDHANTKFSGGYTATGVGGVICARHALVRKCALGDLQKGERYVLWLL